MGKRTNKLIHELYNLDLDIQNLEQRLKKMQMRRHMMSTVDIPESMIEDGNNYIELSDGSNLICEVAHKIYGSLPKREDEDARWAAIDYLQQHQASELIKATVKIEYGKGDMSAANKMKRASRAMADRIESESTPIISSDLDVNHMTLAAWARARIRDNLPTDMGIIGLRALTMATIKKAKGSE